MAPLNVIAERHSSSTLGSMGDESYNNTVASNEVVVMVTPYSTGCCLAQEIQRRGYTLICLWNQGFSDDMKKHVPTSCSELKYLAELTECDDMADTIASLEKTAASGGCKIVGVICGGEAGVDLGKCNSFVVALLFLLVA